ncbi:MAG: 23S rRNA (adenine(2030)-N(6))-methyltransferase RlmJ [Methanothrix sp.]|nr:MAG: 23S rRNA (adenine(2030)-N(6))-methyltransferase RlmJ [Methanothrix sp.]
MRHYDHRGHAGNAGDVWKHFLLLEAASCLLIPDSSLVYAESHVGRPKYALRTPGDWVGGIGKCWPLLPHLKNFCYFEILASSNPSGLKCYPGSASLVLEAAKMRAANLRAEIWDVDPEVAVAWQGRSNVSFHLENGFSGVRSLLDCSPPGLLLIDPPYVDAEDAMDAQKLLGKAKEMGWVVLWWFMMENETIPLGRYERFELEFAKAGMDGGRWKGSVVAVAGADDELLCRLHEQSERFIDIAWNG